METEVRTQSLPPTEWNEEHSGGKARRSSPIVGRNDVLEELCRITLDPTPLFIQGPHGVGTSTLARAYVSELRAQLSDWNPVLIHVDVSVQNCPRGDPSYGVVAALLQHFQPDAPVKGVSRQRVLWWFLRRVAAGGKPVIVWLDELRPNVRSLESVVGSLLNPGTLLGDAGTLPEVYLALSGSGDAGLNGSVKRIQVSPLPAGTIREILESKVRQTSRVWTPGAFGKVTDILATRGNSLSVMDEILATAEKRAGCHGIVVEQDVAAPFSRERTRTSKRQVELRLLGVLRSAGGKLPMGELVDELGRVSSSEGDVPPSPSNVRRWAARMQAHGVLERSVALGGDGGTRSVISLAPGHPSIP